jgi:hypothetical protein
LNHQAASSVEAADVVQYVGLLGVSLQDWSTDVMGLRLSQVPVVTVYYVVSYHERHKLPAGSHLHLRYDSGSSSDGC